MLKYCLLIITCLFIMHDVNAQVLGEPYLPDEFEVSKLQLRFIPEDSVGIIPEEDILQKWHQGDDVNIAYNELFLFKRDDQLHIAYRVELKGNSDWYVSDAITTYTYTPTSFELLNMDGKGQYDVLIRMDSSYDRANVYDIQSGWSTDYILVSIDNEFKSPLIQSYYYESSHYIGYKIDEIDSPTVEEGKKEAVEMEKESNWVTESESVSFNITVENKELVFSDIKYNWGDSGNDTYVNKEIKLVSYKYKKGKLIKEKVVPDKE